MDINPKRIIYIFPIQLVLLHFRKYQILMFFWVFLIAIVNSGFMKNFGADALFFVPEYMGKVSTLAMFFVGVAIGIFILSWNITTFILHSKRFKFLATSSNPFLMYCVNNGIIPLFFIIFYIIKLIIFNRSKELMDSSEIAFQILGFLGGLAFILTFSFVYFFGAHRQILSQIAPFITDPAKFKSQFDPAKKNLKDNMEMKVSFYISTRLRLKKVRPVYHYSKDFLDIIFKRHHFASMLAFSLAFIFLVIVGFFLDVKFFQFPAAASVVVFFCVMNAVIGAITYFMRSWGLVFFIVLIFIINKLYKAEIIDPRNKAYGIDYTQKNNFPDYTKTSLLNMCSPEQVNKSKNNMLEILNKWKKKQTTEKPQLVFINVSGGGLRSATFVINTLQQLDSATHGNIMNKVFLISGASGGMLSTSYFRELYLKKINGNPINLNDPKYTNNITQDLLNPIFSSMISRDIFAPAQKFTVGSFQYVKDRGYAFEQKLSQNSEGLLDKRIGDYYNDEKEARIPLIIFNSVVSTDGRKMMLGTQPLNFMMKPCSVINDTTASPDAIDFGGLFYKQKPYDIKMLSALRMNATFPYILPNVWLPSNPVIDVMDAGLRDNYGQETALRFIDNFRDWINENTSGVLLIQIRDRMRDSWKHELQTATSVTDMFVKPATMLQHNWYKLQDYSQNDQYNYLKQMMGDKLNRVTFMYVPKNEDQTAALNFHLTAKEKQDIIHSFQNNYNQKTLNELIAILNTNKKQVANPASIQK